MEHKAIDEKLIENLPFAIHINQSSNIPQFFLKAAVVLLQQPVPESRVSNIFKLIN